MSNWTGPIIELDDWDEFPRRLNAKALELGLTGDLAIRNFDRVSFDLGPDMEIRAEVDRLGIVTRSGTDRDSESHFWNEEGHDHDHGANPAGKGPADILYAYIVQLTGTDYLVWYKGPPEKMDLTRSLSEANGILVYDASKLLRVAKNELWFLTDPKDVLKMIFLCRGDDD